MRAIYAFSGDPITFGHIDIVKRAARTYSELVVAIGENPAKQGKYLFDAEERLKMVQYALRDTPNISCKIMRGLLAEYAYRHGFEVIVRGVRNNSDLEGELAFFAINQTLHPSTDTVFLPTKPELSHISSSVVKAIVTEGGDASQCCPLYVKEALERRLLDKMFIGVAGGIASGKSTFANQLVTVLGKEATTTYVSLDQIGHYVLSSTPKELYRKTRQQVCQAFGDELRQSDDSIDRRALGKIVFHDERALSELNQIMREPMLARLYEEALATPSGIIILEGAILVEGNWSRLVNNNVILLDASPETRLKRLVDRDGVTQEEARAKIDRQIGSRDRKTMLDRNIRKYGWGKCWELQNDSDEIYFADLAEEILAKWNAPFVL